MGNKHGTTSVFRDEEDEETWFEWMATTGHHKNQKQLTISPKTEILPVQPTSFQVDAKQKISGGDKAFKRLHLVGSENASISADKSLRGEGAENNNLSRIKENVVENDLETLAEQVSEFTEAMDYCVPYLLKIAIFSCNLCRNMPVLHVMTALNFFSPSKNDNILKYTATLFQIYIE